jgi:hypothetical protein
MNKAFLTGTGVCIMLIKYINYKYTNDLVSYKLKRFIKIK